MNKLNDSKIEYNSIEIPEALDHMINTTIKNNNRSRTLKKITAIAASAVILCSTFTITLNTSESFAETLENIPVLSAIADVLTFKDTEAVKENHIEIVKTPEVINLQDDHYESLINQTIQAKVDDILIEAEERMLEYKEAYIETGGSEAGFKDKNYTISVDYDLTFKSEKYLSFAVYSHESLAAVYSNYIYYNLDIETNKPLSLQTLMGDHYRDTIIEVVNKSIQSTKDDVAYFQETLDGQWTLDEDLNFYIDEDKQIVLVFDKYTLAPGSSGRLEFPISNLDQ